MTPPARVNDDDLHAFVDGEADAHTSAEVEAWLAAHPDDAARVDAWRRHKAGLHASYDGVLDEPVPDAMRHALAAARRRALRAGWVRAAAALVLFAAGAGTGWGLHGRLVAGDAAEPSFVRKAVGAHRVFTAEGRHAVEVRADREERHLVRWLSKRLGRTLKPPLLNRFGFRLVGGRLVADAGGPAAQYMYEDASKRRLTLYVRRTRDGGDTAFRFVSERGVAAFYWIDGTLSYALIGPLARAELLKLARIVHQTLSS